VEEDKRQESETLHFPFVTKIFRTMRIQSILILYKGNFEREKEGFFPLVGLYQRILFSPELIKGRSKTLFSVNTRLCVSSVISHFTSFLICVFNEYLAVI
jgi:hypothetical protein